MRIPGESPPTRQLLVGKPRHAPPARMVPPEFFFAPPGGIMLSRVAAYRYTAWGIECIQHANKDMSEKDVAARLLA
jgi:hypothetical protein